jgi:gamma-glutamyltranspeptidase/glutathione hydrolase
VTTGVIATSDPRASHAGAAALDAGGGAVDAAVAAAFVLLVTEPHACGVGGDAFVLFRREGDPAPVALDGSGAIPERLAAQAETDAYEPVPLFGPRTFTVPGAVQLLEEVHRREGRLSFADVLAPAVALAAEGFEVRQTLAAAARRSGRRIAADDVLGPLYVPDGVPVPEGTTVRNPRLAEALAEFAADGTATMYEGRLADAVVRASDAAGGLLGADDLRSHRTVAVTPMSTSFAGTTVWELPAPTQGPAVLAALDHLAAAGEIDAMAVARAILVGLRSVGIDLEAVPDDAGGRGDTTYIACIDGEGLAVSLITSVFADFGSGCGVPELGSALQNRAAGTTLIGQRPCRGKPPHTTIPGLVTRGCATEHVLGVVGGYMQAQGQVQLLVDLLVRGLEPQAAVDAPRFRVLPGGALAAEPGHPVGVADPAALERSPGLGGFGGAQVVSAFEGRLTGGSDRRKGGATAGTTAEFPSTRTRTGRP